MSLQSRLADLITAIGADIKQLKSQGSGFAGARLTHSVNQTASPLGFNTVVYDVGGFTTTANRLTAPATGKFLVIAHAETTTHADDTERYYTLRKNGTTNIDDIFVPRGGSGATLVTTIPLNQGDYLDVINTNIPSTFGGERGLHFEIMQVSGFVASSSAARRTVVSGAGSVTLDALDPTVEAWDVYVDGTLAQAGTARWVGIFPNGDGGPASAGGTARGTLTREWTDAAGAVQQPLAMRTDEHGFVFGALPFTDDQTITAHSHIRSKKDGNPRVARSRMSTAAIGANVNETSDHQSASRWTNTANDLTSLVLDFGGGTFTGVVTLVPANVFGITLPSDRLTDSQAVAGGGGFNTWDGGWADCGLGIILPAGPARNVLVRGAITFSTDTGGFTSTAYLRVDDGTSMNAMGQSNGPWQRLSGEGKVAVPAGVAKTVRMQARVDSPNGMNVAGGYCTLSTKPCT